MDAERSWRGRNTLLTHVLGLPSKAGTVTAIPWTLLAASWVMAWLGALRSSASLPGQREVKPSFNACPAGNKGISGQRLCHFPSSLRLVQRSLNTESFPKGGIK